MKKIQVGMFMDSWYPDLNGVILVMENLIKNMSDYADVTLVVPKTGSEENDKNYPFKIIRVDSVPLLHTGYKLGMVDLKYFKYIFDFDKGIFFTLVSLSSATSDTCPLKRCDCVVLLKDLLFLHLRHATIISLFRNEISLGRIFKIYSDVSRIERKV